MSASAKCVDGPEGHFQLEPTGPDPVETVPARDVTWDVLSRHIKDLIILTDLGGTIFYVSPSCRTFGYSQLDLVGRRAVDLLHPDDLPVGGQASCRARRFRCQDGSWRWLEGNPSTLEGAPGVAVGQLDVLRDVTDRRADRQL